MAVARHPARKCAGGVDENANWPETTAADPPTIVEGTCTTGYFVEAGKPYRGCDITGAFTAVQNPCQRTVTHYGAYP